MRGEQEQKKKLPAIPRVAAIIGTKVVILTWRVDKKRNGSTELDPGFEPGLVEDVIT